jgi:hypothetical protein
VQSFNYKNAMEFAEVWVRGQSPLTHTSASYIVVMYCIYVFFHRGLGYAQTSVCNILVMYSLYVFLPPRYGRSPYLGKLHTSYVFLMYSLYVFPPPRSGLRPNLGSISFTSVRAMPKPRYVTY